MNRAVTEIKWRRRLTDAIGITYTPFAELRGDIYQYRQLHRSRSRGELVDDETVARGLATGGATVSYPWVANASDRLARHRADRPDHCPQQQRASGDDLPDEDAKSLVFDDTNLFETTKFSGYDRLETGMRANVGVQYTFQARSGGMRACSPARAITLRRQRLRGPDACRSHDPTRRSCSRRQRPRDRPLRLRARLLPRADRHVPPHLAEPLRRARPSLQREDVTGLFAYGPLSAQATYTYTAPVVADVSASTRAQQDIIGSLGLRLTDRWSLSGSIRYDLDADQR